MMKKRDVEAVCRKAKEASRALAIIDEKAKNRILFSMSKALIKNMAYIIRENAKDVASARKKKLKSAFIDRLELDPSRIKAMAASLADIARLKDPVGACIEKIVRPNGLLIKKVRVPIGVILMIYESRPNVTSDCIGLCIKSGNASILRGGSESINSNIAIFKTLTRAASKKGLPTSAVTMIDNTDRAIMDTLLVQDSMIDLVMPRGGESLIRYVNENSRIPVIKHYKGVCHVYVDKAADLKMAGAICFNAKVQRPGVCNAMETMLVHRSVAKKFLPGMIRSFQDAGVEIRGDKGVKRIAKNVSNATEKDWYTEYLDLILSVRIVKNADEAIAHIMKYGSYHSDTIVTKDKSAAARFLKEVDSACVYVNASTRFTDGCEFGKGAEIGISTDKIHARGPMGIEELTSYKYMVFGSGQIRK
ncbi:MAG: glutamate-5-semialdehyde dehydrogenase [Candidatus Omnitrophota bacterium]|jgi:glutamate-5-semialdehyde dehydrogenase